MSIPAQIERIRDNVQRALAVCAAAGIDVAAEATSDHLPSAVEALANADIDCGFFTESMASATDLGTF